MGLFGKKPKKREDEAELDDEEEEKPKKKAKLPKDKDFKDLGAENKRGRKEPIKPWGKKERLTVLIPFLITIIIPIILSLQSRDWKLPNLPRIKLPTISFPYFKEETIILEGNKEEKVKADEVLTRFKQMTSPLTGVYGFYVLHLNSGIGYGLYENDSFQAASLIKLPVMEAIYYQSEKGLIDLNSYYFLKEEDKLQGSGKLVDEEEGYQVSMKELVQLMGKQSDNTAFNIAKKQLGENPINEVIQKTGMHKTSLEDNMTTPKDIASFHDNLWRNSLVSKEAKTEILESLTNTNYENWLAGGIDKSVRVAHKYGKETHVINDAGIIYTDEPFVLVIMSKGVIDSEADKVFPKLAKMIYEVENK